MGTITGKMNLAALKHVIQEKKGQGDKMIDCIVIPIEENHLFKSDKGNIYLDIIAFDLKKPDENNTHVLSQSLAKKVRDAMSEEEKKAMKPIGNLNINFGGGEGGNANATPGVTLGAEDDLPF